MSSTHDEGNVSIIVACLLFMVTLTEGKPFAKKHYEATEKHQSDTNEHESEDHEVNEESEDEHSGGSGHLSDGKYKSKLSYIM